MSGLMLRQVKDFVVVPACVYLKLHSLAAEKLLMGTIAHESRGRFLDQVLGPDDRTLGPAYGLFQIEAATHVDLYENFLEYRRELRIRLRSLQADWPDEDTQLATNLMYAAAVARLIYYRDAKPLPAPDNIRGLARYWKRVYNTPAGKGEVEDWLMHWDRDVATLYA